MTDAPVGPDPHTPPGALQLRYHPKADRRTALVAAATIAPWALYFWMVDAPDIWWAYAALLGLTSAIAVRAHLRQVRRRPVALTISDQGLVHHDRDGHPTWRFPWNDGISMNVIAGSGVGGHHHIGANITELAPEELFGLLEDHVEVRRLEHVRRLKAELD